MERMSERRRKRRNNKERIRKQMRIKERTERRKGCSNERTKKERMTEKA